MTEELVEDISWRDESIRKRLGFALIHDKVYKDILFIVGKSEEEFSAHKLILRLSSLVFENLISTHEKGGLNIIRLPNASPRMFGRLLKFIYTDELEMDDFVQFFRVAKDFGFQKLAEKSAQVLKQTKITYKNVFMLLEISKGIEDCELEETVLEFIRRNAKTVLESETFIDISYDSLCLILMDDALCTDEVTVFRAALRWITCKCKSSQIPATGENIRGVLKHARLYIRYLQMTYEQLVTEVKESGILSNEEHLQVLKTFVNRSDNPLGLSIIPRQFGGVEQTMEHNEETNHTNNHFYPGHIELQNENIQQSVQMLTVGYQSPTLLQQPVIPVIFSTVMQPALQQIQIQTPPILSESTQQRDNFGTQLLVPRQIRMGKDDSIQISISKPLLGSSPKKARSPNVFRLQNCCIDFRDIVNATQLQFSLQKIILHNVTFQSFYNPLDAGIRRTFLPNLKLFHFSQDVDMLVSLPDKSFMNGLTTKEFLFFEIDNQEPWNFSSLWSLGVKICLDVKGLRLMELNPSEKKLTLAYPVEEEVDLILESLYKQQDLKSLCLSACNIKSSFDLPTINIETLVLQGVTFKDGKAMFYINKCRSLKNLSVFVPSGIKVDLSRDFKMQRLTLERMALANAEILGLSTKNSSSVLSPFPRLEELYLDVCSWSLSFETNISNLFPNLKRIAIRSKSACRPVARFIMELLEIKSIERITLFRYHDSNEDRFSNPNVNLFLPPVTKYKESVTDFLLAAGITFGYPKSGSGGKEVPDFIVQKDLTTGRWAVVSDLMNELDETHFQYSMLKEFYASSSVSKLIQ